MDTVAVQGQAGVAIELPVARGSATGYDWVLDLPQGIAPAEDGPGTPPPPGRSLGAISGAHLRVTATAPGRYKLTARLIRSWEPDAPARTVEIDLDVK